MTPRNEETNRRMRERSRQALIRAGLELFAERGFGSVTVAEIARRAGASKGLMYRYVEGKEQLLQEILRERVREAGAVVGTVDQTLPPDARLRQLVERVLGDAADRAEELRLYLSLRLQPGSVPAVEDEIAAEVAELQAPLVELFREAGSDAPEVDADLVQATVDGLVLRILAGPDPGVPHAWIEATARRLAEHVLPVPTP